MLVIVGTFDAAAATVSTAMGTPTPGEATVDLGDHAEVSADERHVPR